MKKLYLTAALGERFLPAAERLTSQIKRFDANAGLMILNKTNLSELCPYSNHEFRNVLSEEVKGFGYFAWKSEFVYRAVKGDFGKYSQVIWIDAGCEVHSNWFTKMTFTHRTRFALKFGVWVHCLNTPEIRYTKKEVLEKFLENWSQPDIQFQANYFHLAGEKGIDLAGRWFEMTSKGIEFLDFQLRSPQFEQFVEHRNDQSLFSIACKNMKIGCNRDNLPTGRGMSKVRAFREPVWISRNRTGSTIKNSAKVSRNG